MAGLICIHPRWLRIKGQRLPAPAPVTSALPVTERVPEPPSPDAGLPLPALLVTLRKRRGWTQEDLMNAVCAITGATKWNANGYEHGTTVPGLRMLIVIADALDLDRAERLSLIEAAGYRINVGDES